MKLFQAVKTCGEIASLGLSEDYFADSVIDTPSDPMVATLALAAEFVVDELFADSGASIVRQTVTPEKSKVTLPQGCRVISVTDKQRNSVDFRYVEGGIHVESDVVCVTYTTPHTTLQWRGELPLPNNGINDRAVVYGMMSEYFVLCGDVEQAALWRARFEDCLAQTSVKRHGGNLPVGRWL